MPSIALIKTPPKKRNPRLKKSSKAGADDWRKYQLELPFPIAVHNGEPTYLDLYPPDARALTRSVGPLLVFVDTDVVLPSAPASAVADDGDMPITAAATKED